MSGSVWAVQGEVRADDLGVVMTHEHLLVDLTCYWELNGDPTSGLDPVEPSRLAHLRSNPFSLRDNCLLTDWAVAVAEAAVFRDLGGGTLVDVTLPELGRDVVGLRRIAEATGLVIVAGCGHYVHVAHPPSVATEPVADIADRLVRELTEGIDGTDIRAGVIGEIGTSAPIHPDERKVLEAAARAHVATGAPITVHLHPGGRTGHEVLDVVEQAGGDLERVVLGHLDCDLGRSGAAFQDELDYQRSLADRGCFVEYDTCGMSSNLPATSYSEAFTFPSDRERAVALAALVEAGYHRQLLLSQDVCKKSELLRYGGAGYGHVLRDFVDVVRRAGVSERVVAELLVDNPRRMLTGA